MPFPQTASDDGRARAGSGNSRTRRSRTQNRLPVTSVQQSPEIPTLGIAYEPGDAVARIGGIVAQYRARLGQVQKKLAETVLNSNRTEIAELEEGKRLPAPEKLEAICEALNIPPNLWVSATHPEFLRAMEFQKYLSELLGKPLSIERLGPDAAYLAVDRIAKLLTGQHSSTQAYDAFRSVLTFYGERPPTMAFFERFLGSDAFRSLDTFRQKIRAFLALGLRLYGNFRRSWKRLSQLEDLSSELRHLESIDVAMYTQRRPFKSISTIPPDRLDDLGYISVERAKKEHRDRAMVSEALLRLADQFDRTGAQALEEVPEPRQRRLASLLKQFGSSLELSVSLFSNVSAQHLRAEADRIRPTDADLARIGQTQEQGLRNLCAYLTEPFIDVYVATSMREHADFVAVNAFVEAVFEHQDISHLNLRYFNPTQSWIEDRVAKGLVEALMLRRSRITIYMAQRGDTFGKDSEASVALGQGKAVLVYVPRLYDKHSGVDSQQAFRMTEAALRDRLKELGAAEEEGLEHKELVGEVLHAELSRLSPEELARVVAAHWADFDLPGEGRHLQDSVKKAWTTYFRSMSETSTTGKAAVPDGTLAGMIVDRLAELAVFFERRASLFRDTHPLALQVIVETGVLNGMMVVRSVDECASVMYRLLTNTIEMQVTEDDHNYRLCEVMTQSALRVVSKYPLLTNAFWTQYFEQRDEPFHA